LEQFPAVDSGLSRTERQAILVLHQHGPPAGRRIFAAVQRLQEQVFMGEGSFCRQMDALSSMRASTSPNI
jgi:hypothetical protein